MRTLYVLLVVFTVVIFAVSIAAAAGHGYNWPATFFPDLLALDWRAQFNTDLLLHLVLLGAWVAWREGGTGKGWLFGLLCVAWGGMFSFPYLLWAGCRAGGDPAGLLLGVHRARVTPAGNPRPLEGER